MNTSGSFAARQRHRNYRYDNQEKKQQKPPAAPAKVHNRTPEGKRRKHITFRNGENKVSIISGPTREEMPGYWFTETEKVVAKPMLFEVPPQSQISIEIETSVQIISIFPQVSMHKKEETKTGSVTQKTATIDVDPSGGAEKSILASTATMDHSERAKVTPPAALKGKGGNDKKKEEITNGEQEMPIRGAPALGTFSTDAPMLEADAVEEASTVATNPSGTQCSSAPSTQPRLASRVAAVPPPLSCWLEISSEPNDLTSLERWVESLGMKVAKKKTTAPAEWFCVAASPVGVLSKVKVTLPRGSYMLRNAHATASVHVWAIALDLDRKLV